MGGREPYFNPTASGLAKSGQAPHIIGHKQDGNMIVVSYRKNGADVTYADLIYTPNEGREWLLASGEISPDEVIYKLPPGTTHYFINLVDENNFLTIYPPIDDQTLKKENLSLIDAAFFAGHPEPVHGDAIAFAEVYRRRLSTTPPTNQLATYDFEDHNLDQLHRGGTGSSITNAFSAAGTQSLEMKECDGNERQWMPLINIPLPENVHAAAAGYQISFDAMLDNDLPGTLSLNISGPNSYVKQKQKKKQNTLATVVIAKDGIRVNTCLLAPSPPGSWNHFDFQWIPTSASNRTVRVTITTERGDTWQKDVPLEDYFFRKVTDIQIISTGDPNTKSYIDNVVVTSNTEAE